MSHAPGPTDYRGPGMDETNPGASLSDTAQALGERSLDLAGEVGAAIKERPFTALTVAAGLAFAVGALWMVGRQRPQSRLEAWRARLPELPARESLLPRAWR
jgi:hypothetical protein